MRTSADAGGVEHEGASAMDAAIEAGVAVLAPPPVSGVSSSFHESSNGAWAAVTPSTPECTTPAPAAAATTQPRRIVPPPVSKASAACGSNQAESAALTHAHSSKSPAIATVAWPSQPPPSVESDARTIAHATSATPSQAPGSAAATAQRFAKAPDAKISAPPMAAAMDSLHAPPAQATLFVQPSHGGAGIQKATPTPPKASPLHSSTGADAATGASDRTQFFLMNEDEVVDESSDEICPPRTDVSAVRGNAREEEAAIESPRGRERRELEESKVSLRRAVQRQQQVDQTVDSLLRRLDELPVGAGIARTDSKDSSGAAATAAESKANNSPAPLRPLQSRTPPPLPTQPIAPPQIRGEASSSGAKPSVAARLPPTASSVAAAAAAAAAQVSKSSSPQRLRGQSASPGPEEAPTRRGAKVSKSSSPQRFRGQSTSPGPEEGPTRRDAKVSDVEPAGATVKQRLDISAAVEAGGRTAQTLGSVSPEVKSPRNGVQFGQTSPADCSLVRGKAADSDLWRGWTIQTSRDGRLFYHHAGTRTSQWHMPKELSSVLGEWVRVQPGDAGAEAGSYWRNELLGVSAWKDPRHTTNLFQAALDGNLFFLQLYAEVGGYLDAVDAKGRAALHYNCAGGSIQAVIYLLQSRAAVDMQDHGGSTPLHWACRYGHAPIVRILLESRANPDVQNTLGDTSMHEAAVLGRVDPLHWLVLARANPTLRNRESRTPAEVAARSQAGDAEGLLRKHELRPCGWSQGRVGGTPEENRRRYGSRSCAAAHREQRRRRKAARRPQLKPAPVSGSDGEKDQDDACEPSLALLVVRGARPLLRGVHWLANRVLGEKKVVLGAVHRPEATTHETDNGGHYEEDESEASVDPGFDDDDDDYASGRARKEAIMTN